MGENMGWRTVVYGALTALLTTAISNGWLPEGSDEQGTVVIESIARAIDGVLAAMTIYGMRKAQAKAITAAQGGAAAD